MIVRIAPDATDTEPSMLRIDCPVVPKSMIEFAVTESDPNVLVVPPRASVPPLRTREPDMF